MYDGGAALRFGRAGEYVRWYKGESNSVMVKKFGGRRAIALRTSLRTAPVYDDQRSLVEEEMRISNLMGHLGIAPAIYFYFADYAKGVAVSVMEAFDVDLYEWLGVGTRPYTDIRSIRRDVNTVVVGITRAIASISDMGICIVGVRPADVLIKLPELRVAFIDWDARHVFRAIGRRAVFNSLDGLGDGDIRAFTSVFMLGALRARLEGSIRKDDAQPTFRDTIIMRKIDDVLNASAIREDIAERLSDFFVKHDDESFLQQYFIDEHLDDLTDLEILDLFISGLGVRLIGPGDVSAFNGVVYGHDASSACCESKTRELWSRSFDEAMGRTHEGSIDDVDFPLPAFRTGVVGEDITLEEIEDLAGGQLAARSESGHLAPRATTEPYRDAPEGVRLALQEAIGYGTRSSRSSGSPSSMP